MREHLFEVVELGDLTPELFSAWEQICLSVQPRMHSGRPTPKDRLAAWIWLIFCFPLPQEESSLGLFLLHIPQLLVLDCHEQFCSHPSQSQDLEVQWLPQWLDDEHCYFQTRCNGRTSFCSCQESACTPPASETLKTMLFGSCFRNSLHPWGPIAVLLHVE